MARATVLCSAAFSPIGMETGWLFVLSFWRNDILSVQASKTALMLRLLAFIRNSINTKDWCGLGLLCFIIAVACWAVSIALVPAMRDLALRRFHVASDSYPLWAAHQAVPSMYNFENKVQFSNQVLGDRSFNPADDSYRSMVLNHFPGNIITFGDWAPTLFACQREGTFEMCSRYQNRLLLSRWTIRSPGDGKPMVIQRHSEQWMDQVD